MTTNLAVVKQTQGFSLVPRTLEEAMQYSKIICDSDFCPREHKGKPGNILICIQYGSEIGLSPTQSLQSISVINGKPGVYGDALLAIVMAHPSFVNVTETLEGGVATCKVERKNRVPVIKTFSVEDAKRAQLWGKPGPWTQYCDRMLQMRARSFALRDAFPDAIKGLIASEELLDYTPKQNTHKKNHAKETVVSPVNEINVCNKVVENHVNDVKVSEIDLKADIESILNSENLPELQESFFVITRFWKKKKDADALAQIIQAKEKRKSELEIIRDFNSDEGEIVTGEIV